MSLNLQQQYSSSNRLVGLGSEKVILNVSCIPEWLGEFSKLWFSAPTLMTNYMSISGH